MKRHLLSSLFIFTISMGFAFSQDEDPSCVQPDGIQKFGMQMLAFTAPLKECPTDDERIMKIVAQEYSKFYGALPQVVKNVKGFQLKGSAKELELAELILGAKPPKGWSTAAKACQTIQCAFEKLLNSKEAAMQMFNFNAKSGYVLSLDQTINQNLADQMWSAREIRELDGAATKMPKQIQGLPHLKTIQRMADGYRRGGHDTNVAAFASPSMSGTGNGELVVYDSGMGGMISKGTPYDQASSPQEVLIHEICHHHDYKGFYATNQGTMTTEQKGSTFSALSGWKEKTGKNGEPIWVHGDKAQFVTAYASTQPAEDFAETCSNFILFPEVLAKKAPAKFEYMKNSVFGGIDNRDKPWSKAKDVSWPKLNDLVASGEGCSTTLVECTKGIKYDYGSFTSPESSKTTTTGGFSSTMWSYGSAESQIKTNTCFAQYKNDRAKKIEEELSKTDEYCDKGGQAVIKNASAKICAQAEDQLAKVLEAAAKIDMTDATKNCEKEKDYTTDCILSKATHSVQAPKEMIPAVNRIIASKVPKRMSALGDNLDALGTNKWLKSCLGGISEMTVISPLQGETFVKYESKDKDYYDSYRMGRDLYEDRNSKDVNMGCAEKILNLYKEAGFKTPASENPINLMKKPLADEMTSFEVDVLEKIHASTKKCLFKKCKREKITELVDAWEKKEPIKRAGVTDEAFVEEIMNKTSSY